MNGTDRIGCKPAQISKADLFYPIVRQDESIVVKAQRGHLSRIATERTYVAILDCANHRLVICHDLSPRGVDNDTPACQRSEFFLAHEMECVGTTRGRPRHGADYNSQRTQEKCARGGPGGARYHLGPGCRICAWRGHGYLQTRREFSTSRRTALAD